MVDIVQNLDLIAVAVQQFDVRFILRALRAISTIRKHLRKGREGTEVIRFIQALRNTRSAAQSKSSLANKQSKVGPSENILPEEDIYLAIIEQV